MKRKTSGRFTPPNRHVGALCTFVALLPFVYYVPPWIVQNVTKNRLAATVIAVAVIVPLISYVVLPGMFWVLNRLRG